MLGRGGIGRTEQRPVPGPDRHHVGDAIVGQVRHLARPPEQRVPGADEESIRDRDERLERRANARCQVGGRGPDESHGVAGEQGTQAVETASDLARERRRLPGHG